MIATALAALALAACAGASAQGTTQLSMFFAAGCWSAWENYPSPRRRMVGFLRLHVGDGSAYSGIMSSYADDGTQIDPGLHLSFAHDGSRAVVVKDGETFEFTPDPTNEMVTVDGWRRAEFKLLTPGKPGGISVSGSREKLSLTIRIGDVVKTFHGVRDGCD